MRKIHILALLIAAACSPEKPVNTASTALTAFIENFEPSAGRGRLRGEDEMSESSFNAQLTHTKEQLQKLRGIDTAQLSFDEKIDWKFAQSILAGRELEQEKMQFWRKDPRLYMAFTGISDMINKPGALTDKIEPIKKRLEITPTQLSNAKILLTTYVPRFQELGLFMAENGFALFDQELPDFISSVGDDGSQLQEPATKARQALTDFIKFLKDELPTKTAGNFPIGLDTYNQMLNNQYLLGMDADSLYEYGWDQFNKTVEELEAVALAIDPKKTWQQLAVEIKNEYPEPAKMIEAHQEWVDKSAAHIKSNDLIPIPWQEKVNVVPRAAYLRKTSYYGNFSIAKGKDKDSVYTFEWMINPFEDQWDEKRKQEYLVEHD